MSSGLGLTSGELHDYQEHYGPLAADLLVADRLRHMGTGGIPYEESVVTTCGTAYFCDTNASTANYLPNHGIIRATATGYYTISRPDRPGLDLVLFTYGTTDQFFRVSSNGTVGTPPVTFAHGTGTSFVVFNNSSHANNCLHLKSLSTSLWALMSASGTIASGTYAVATSSG
jgi:hypothetical protein